jgi:hypothetical protein
VVCFSDPPDRLTAFAPVRVSMDDDVVALTAHCSSLLSLDHMICISDPPDHRTAHRSSWITWFASATHLTAFASGRMSMDDDVAALTAHCSSLLNLDRAVHRKAVGSVCVMENHDAVA